MQLALEPPRIAALPGAHHGIHFFGQVVRLFEAGQQVLGLGIQGHVLEHGNLIMDGFEPVHALAVAARPVHEVHFNAVLGLEAELRQLQLGNGLGREPGRKLIEAGQLHTDLMGQCGGPLIALLPQYIG